MKLISTQNKIFHGDKAKWEHIFQNVSDGPQTGNTNMVYCVSLKALKSFCTNAVHSGNGSSAIKPKRVT
jgi:hypothetical protein